MAGTPQHVRNPAWYPTTFRGSLPPFRSSPCSLAHRSGSPMERILAALRGTGGGGWWLVACCCCTFMPSPQWHINFAPQTPVNISSITIWEHYLIPPLPNGRNNFSSRSQLAPRQLSATILTRNSHQHGHPIRHDQHRKGNTSRPAN